MTGFSGIEPIDADQGFADNTRGNYFKRWTTVGLPDQGRNSAHDDDQQPVGSGADETVLEGTPLKVPMEAEDIPRPKIREGREASSKAMALRKVALKIRKVSPVYARRLMAAADELEYDDLSTARLELSGDEANPVDDSQDNNGHGELQFWGTAPARKTSLPRESSRRRRACSIGQTEGGDYILQDEGGFKIDGPFDSKAEAQEAQESYMKEMEEEQEKSANLEYASRGASRSRPSRRRATSDSDASGGHNWNHNDWKAALDLVPKALEGKYDRGAVSKILDAEYKRTSDLLRGNSTSPAQAADPHVRQGDTVPPRMARRRKRARAEGDAPLHPEPTVGDQDGPGADGASAFVDRAKAPLQETMTADDVDRPRLRENPEASRIRAGKTFWGKIINQPGGYELLNKVMELSESGERTPEYRDGLKELGRMTGLSISQVVAAVREMMGDPGKTRYPPDDAPHITNSRESSRSLWAAFKEALKRKGSIEGDWNDGRYQVAARDYGNTLEITASVRDREGIETPVGNVTLSVINDSPDGRYASIEMNDDLIEKQVRDFTLRRKQAGRLASWIVAEAVDVSKGALEHITC